MKNTLVSYSGQYITKKLFYKIVPRATFCFFESGVEKNSFENWVITTCANDTQITSIWSKDSCSVKLGKKRNVLPILTYRWTFKSSLAFTVQDEQETNNLSRSF